MYVPKHFEEHDVATLHQLIRSHPLGAWVTPGAGELVVNHIPFLVDGARGPNGTLVGHVARANPVWRSLSASPSVVIFQGPQAYITPSWYPSKQEHGRVVPTWNYAVVHAHGVPLAIDDRDWLRAHVAALSERHEAHRDVPWHVTDAPADYIDALLKAIVGIEIPVDALAGKWKASQNRPLADILGAVEGLSAEDDGSSRQMAETVKERLPNRAGGGAPPR